MLEGVAVVWMPVQDIERAKDFYGDTLALKILNGPFQAGFGLEGHDRTAFDTGP